MSNKVFLTGIIALTICGVTSMTAQVGINTEKPTTSLDIVQPDSTNNPGHGFRLRDGNEDAGKVLTSDVGGTGTWKYTALQMIESKKENVQTNIPLTSDSTWKVCNMTITLPPGSWKVDYNAKCYRLPGDVNILNPDCFFIETSLCDDASTPNPTPDIPIIYQLISCSYVADPYLETLGIRHNQSVQAAPSGFWILNNTSGSAKTYHIITRCAAQSVKYPDSYLTFSPNDREDKMVATPILP